MHSTAFEEIIRTEYTAEEIDEATRVQVWAYAESVAHGDNHVKMNAVNRAAELMVS